MNRQSREICNKYMQGVPLTESLSDKDKAREFLRQCPDFPMTEEAINDLGNVINLFHCGPNYEVKDIKDAWFFTQHLVKKSAKEIFNAED